MQQIKKVSQILVQYFTNRCQWAANVWVANVSGWQMSERPMSLGGKCQAANVSGRQMSNVCFMAHVKTTNVQNDQHLVASTYLDGKCLGGKSKEFNSAHVG